MKKLLARLLGLIMILSAFGYAGAEAVSADNIVISPEFQVMTLGNYKYATKENDFDGDYTSLYEKYGAGITIADVTEDEETGFGYITVDGEEKLLGLDFLSKHHLYIFLPSPYYLHTCIFFNFVILYQ